jgi:AraC-like DNA-binding protein
MEDRRSKLYYNHITSLKLRSYEFSLHYAEEMDSTVAEFPHQHPLYEIYYSLEDTVHIYIKKEEVHLKKHEMLLVSKNIRHQVFYEPDRQFKYFVLIFDFFPLISKTIKGPDGINEWDDLKRVLDKADSAGFMHSKIPFDGHLVLDLIRGEQEEKALAWNTFICFIYYQFTIKAIRHLVKIKNTDFIMAGKLNLGLEASKFIHKHYAEDITLEDVAEYLNISPRHVNREYINMFNTTFIKNLNLVRVEYAKRYLCTTDYSNEKIAEMVGFSCVQTLYKLFKEYEGIAISHYRREYRRV